MITAFPERGAQYQVSTNGGERPVWSRDGKQIFYRENLKLMAVAVKTQGRTLELGTPSKLFEVAVRNLSGRWYDVSPDGRFLMNTSPGSAQVQNIELVVSWPTELKQVRTSAFHPRNLAQVTDDITTSASRRPE